MVDDFFYQVSREYSPSTQDPQLQVAGMISYGLRILEGDSRVVQQLFYFLFNNFKLAVINDRLDEEVVMLQRGMENPGILDFALGTMLPAIARTAVKEGLGFCLLDVYICALQRVIDGSALVLAVDSKVLLRPLLSMVKAVDQGFAELSGRGWEWQPETYYVAGQLVALVNLMWPLLEDMSMAGVDGFTWNELTSALEHIKEMLSAVASSLEPRIEERNFGLDTPEFSDSPHGGPRTTPRIIEEPVKQFSDIMVESIRKDWTVSEAAAGQQRRVTVQAPGKGPPRGPSATQGLQGVTMPQWNSEKLLRDLNGHAKEWMWWWNMVLVGIVERSAPVTQALNVIF
jgi:hypothetical protein